MAPLRPGTLNEQRYFLVEPPFYQAVVAGFYRLFGVKESLARLVSILFSLGALVFLFLLVSRLVNSWVGLLSAFFMAVLPYSIFYSRVIMPESMMLFAALGMLWFFWLWLEKTEKRPLFLGSNFYCLGLANENFSFVFNSADALSGLAEIQMGFL